MTEALVSYGGGRGTLAVVGEDFLTSITKGLQPQLILESP